MEKGPTSGDIQHVDEEGRNVVLASQTGSDKVWNPLLILSCVAFGCTSVLFGYDDKVVSPVAAMEPFVSQNILWGDCKGFVDKRLTWYDCRRLPSSKAPIPRLATLSSPQEIRIWSFVYPLLVPS